MSKTLEERLQDAKKALGKIDNAITRHAGKLNSEVEKQFKEIAAFASNIDHWNQMVAARQTSRDLLESLELRADQNDDVPYGSSKAKFQTVRLLGVQGYLAAQWALADCLVGMSGKVLCIRNSLQDPTNTPQLVSHFVGEGANSKIAAIAFYSLRQSFGLPIAISYTLRNHFLHDGAGGNFFDGPTARSAFKISVQGSKHIEERIKKHDVKSTFSRLNPAFGFSAGDDLRDILDMCAPEIDEALGILVGSACQIAMAHLGFMLGED
jgi:hypothetical protein